VINNIRECRYSSSRGLRESDFPTLSRQVGWRLILLFGGLIGVASAEVFGDFTYEVNPTTNPVSVIITDYPTTAIGPVMIPEFIEGMRVTAIGREAFAFCVGISGVTVPASVTSIGEQAFLNCSSLASVGDLSGVTSIESAAFFSCIALTSITLPAGVTGLSDSIFGSCTGLTSVTILGDVTFIGNSAFIGCSGLTNLTIPATVTTIGTSVFQFCTGLTNMEIPNGVSTLSFALFADCMNLASVTVPASLTSISGSVFAKCSKLTSLSAPGAVTTPPSIVIPSAVTSLGTYVFSECSALTSVVIPPGVPSIGINTFELCMALMTITIPSSVTTFGNNAFRSCSSLLSFEINSGADTTIGTNVFEGTTAMVSITVNPANLSFSSEGGVLFNKLKTTLLIYPRGLAGAYVIPSSVTAIAAGAFRFAGGVTSIRIPATCTASGLESFAGCSSLASFTVAPGVIGPSGFKSGTGPLFSFSGLSLVAYPGGLGGAVSIPNTVSTISASAFRYNNLLTRVTFPPPSGSPPVSVITIRDTAFANCGQLTSAIFHGNAPPTVGTNVFQSAATGFTVYFNPTATGATFPTWKTYRSEYLETISGIANWLQSYNLPISSDLESDANGDGVSLLMAYALNLNPGQDLSGSLPQPVFSAEQMSMSFYAGASGVTYVVEVSPDLVNWITEGVSYSNLDLTRTATASRTTGSRFMRLLASY
jgi:hypothetical protein